MLGNGIINLFTNSTFYQFNRNLLREPDSAKALHAFIFNVNKEKYLTNEESIVAGDSELFFNSLNYEQVSDLIDIIISKRHKLLEALDTRWFYGGLSISIGRKYFPISITAGLINYLFNTTSSRFTPDISYIGIPSIYNLDGYGFKFIKAISNLALNIIYFRYIAAMHTIGSTTPLHRAAKAQDSEKFRELIRRGSNPELIDNQWKNALNLLRPNSELHKEFAPLIARMQVENEYGFSEACEEFLRSLQLKARAVALGIDRTASHYLKIFMAANINIKNMRPKELLMHTVQIGDAHSIQEILSNIRISNILLSTDEQTDLFKNAKSISVLQALLVNGLEFRPYLFNLYSVKHGIEFSGMGASILQKKIAVFLKLLPHFDENVLEKITDADHTFCPITYAKQSHAIRIDNNPNDPNKFELDALFDWVAQKNECIHPSTKIPFELNDITFDLATFEFFRNKISTADLSSTLFETNPTQTEHKITDDLLINIGRSARQIATQVLESHWRISFYNALLEFVLPPKLLSIICMNHTILSLIYTARELNSIKFHLHNPLYSNEFLANLNTAFMHCYVFNKTLTTLQMTNIKFAPINNMIYDQLNLFYILTAMNTFGLIVNFNAPQIYEDETTHEFTFAKPEDFVVSDNSPVISYWKDILRQREGGRVQQKSNNEGDAINSIVIRPRF